MIVSVLTFWPPWSTPLWMVTFIPDRLAAAIRHLSLGGFIFICSTNNIYEAPTTCQALVRELRIKQWIDQEKKSMHLWNVVF
jgi:hypothetical protein